MTHEHFIALRKYVMIRLPPMPNIRFIGTSMAGGAIIENLFIMMYISGEWNRYMPKLFLSSHKMKRFVLCGMK